MRFSRWLLTLCANANHNLDRCYEDWGKALVGSPTWRSGVIASGELGWGLSGFMRGILHVVKKRAKLFMLPPDDLYARVFRTAGVSGSLNWAVRSLDLLNRWDILDYPSWDGGDCLLLDYMSYASGVLHWKHMSTWRRAAARHCIPVPHEQVLPGISYAIKGALVHNLSWEHMMWQRAHVQLRCGLLELGHLSGRTTHAKNQRCLLVRHPNCVLMAPHIWRM